MYYLNSYNYYRFLFPKIGQIFAYAVYGCMDSNYCMTAGLSQVVVKPQYKITTPTTS